MTHQKPLEVSLWQNALDIIHREIRQNTVTLHTANSQKQADNQTCTLRID